MRSRVLSRRDFLHTSTAATLTAASWSRVYGANEKLRYAAIGTGGKGWDDLVHIAASPKVDVVALCDIDESAGFLGRAADKYPSAKKFTDWRRVMEAAKAFDAVSVSTPDH